MDRARVVATRQAKEHTVLRVPDAFLHSQVERVDPVGGALFVLVQVELEDRHFIQNQTRAKRDLQYRVRRDLLYLLFWDTQSYQRALVRLRVQAVPRASVPQRLRAEYVRRKHHLQVLLVQDRDLVLAVQVLAELSPVLRVERKYRFTVGHELVHVSSLTTRDRLTNVRFTHYISSGVYPSRLLPLDQSLDLLL